MSPCWGTSQLRTRRWNEHQDKAPDDTYQDAQKPKENHKIRPEWSLFAFQVANDLIVAHAGINRPAPVSRGLYYAGQQGTDNQNKDPGGKKIPGERDHEAPYFTT